jgi:hypothetical protein
VQVSGDDRHHEEAVHWDRGVGLPDSGIALKSATKVTFLDQMRRHFAFVTAHENNIV